MIGQTNLIAHLGKLGLSSKFPKLLILVGEEGQGKKTLARYVVEEVLNWQLYIPEELKIANIRTMIETGNSLTWNRVYCLFDADQMNNAAQNAMLKFAEEPPPYAYIIITVKSEKSLLPTIKSRGMILNLEPYSEEELRLYANGEELYGCTNPGQIDRMRDVAHGEMVDLCLKVITNIGRISAANAFKILSHVKKEEVELFLPMLLKCYSQQLLAGLRCSAEIKVLYKYKSQVENKSINTTNALEMMLLELRKAAENRA